MRVLLLYLSKMRSNRAISHTLSILFYLVVLYRIFQHKVETMIIPTNLKIFLEQIYQEIATLIHLLNLVMKLNRKRVNRKKASQLLMLKHMYKKSLYQ